MFRKKSTENEPPDKDPPEPSAGAERRKGFFRRLRERLNKGESWLTYDLAHLMPGGKPNEDFLEEMETRLLSGDVGVEATTRIMDGLDNFDTRFLINDVSLKHGIPWVYGAAIASSGMTMSIIPGKTPCFRCLSASAPAGGMVGTCDTAGIIGPAPSVIGAMQVAQAMKILIGEDITHEPVTPQYLTIIDVWRGTFQRLKTGYRRDCPACQGRYEHLEGKSGLQVTSLCGQNVVQVLNTRNVQFSLPDLAARLDPVAKVTVSDFMLRFTVDDDKEMIVFPDGRALVRNTTDESLARALYAKYIGT